MFVSKNPTLSNHMPYGGPWTPSEIPVGEFDDTESETSAHTTVNQSATEKKRKQKKKKKKPRKKGLSMKTAASALSEIVKGAANSYK